VTEEPRTDKAPKTAAPQTAAPQTTASRTTAPEQTGPAERALASALQTVFGVLRVAMIVVLVALVFSNTRFLQQNQRAVILRFGKVVGTGAGRVHGPGLVFAWPQPIDEIIIVDAGRIQSLELDDFMYRKSARGPDGESLGLTLTPGLDGYTLTGDANILHTIWGVQYQVDDVVSYALNVEDPEALIRRALAAAVVHTCAEFNIEEALWADIEGMRRRVTQRLQDRLDEVASGIRVVRISTPAREEPKQTKEAFVRATQASLTASEDKQQGARYRETLLAMTAGDVGPELAAKLTELAEAEEVPEEARDEAKNAALRAQVQEMLERAGGKATTILSEAKTYRTKVREDARSMAETFDALEAKYRENPDVFVRQTYQNAMQQVLSRAGVKFILYPRTREWWIKIEPRKKKPEKKAEEVVVETEPERMRRELRGF
jgi:membrane protease subunit HflK